MRNELVEKGDYREKKRKNEKTVQNHSEAYFFFAGFFSSFLAGFLATSLTSGISISM
jgi:cytochrome bd-type quinol oxidase subunit 2